jgi:RNA-directed DNA polymerase
MAPAEEPAEIPGRDPDSHRYTFSALDKWVRMRLRSVLRHRAHRAGRETGREHREWPNAFFAEHGLFSLAAASALARQSSRR